MERDLPDEEDEDINNENSYSEFGADQVLPPKHHHHHANHATANLLELTDDESVAVQRKKSYAPV